jgi:uncharacterized protein (TIGR02246 family)
MRAHWSWSKAWFVLAALASAGAGGYLAVRTTGSAVGDERVGHHPAATDPTSAADEKTIAKNRSAYIKAFNAGDARALALLWAEDGEFVDEQGRSFRGRAAIEKEFASFFARDKGLTLEIDPGSLRFISPTVALENCTGRVTRASDGAATLAGCTILHTKRDGNWLLASVRETPFLPGSNYERLRDLEWLVGQWRATGGGHTLDLSCEWAEKRNFLLRRYSVKDDDGITHTGLQIIGWDPVIGGIRSWLFDSGGGFGSERWARDGKRWLVEATGTTRDGRLTQATNVLTRLDHDSFTWQSLRRSLNGTRLPDTPLIKVTRVKARK